MSCHVTVLWKEQVVSRRILSLKAFSQQSSLSFLLLDDCALMTSALKVKVQFTHPEATSILPNRQVQWTAAGTTSTDHFWSNQTEAVEKLLHLFRSVSAWAGVRAMGSHGGAELLASPLPFFGIHYHQISATLILLLSSSPNSEPICSEQPSLFNFSLLISAGCLLLLFVFVKSPWVFERRWYIKCTIISSSIVV